MHIYIICTSFSGRSRRGLGDSVEPPFVAQIFCFHTENKQNWVEKYNFCLKIQFSNPPFAKLNPLFEILDPPLSYTLQHISNMHSPGYLKHGMNKSQSSHNAIFFIFLIYEAKKISNKSCGKP